MRHLRLLALPCLILPALAAQADPTPPAPVMLRGERPGSGFGWQVAPAGDLTGDGIPELVVGAPGYDLPMAFAGRAYIVRRLLPQFPPARSARPKPVSTFAFGDNLGFSVASAGDVNGDGLDDLLMGARGNDTAAIQAGRVYLFLGPVLGTSTDQADAVISGTAFEEIGRSVSAAGDLNGDGLGDILVGTGVGGPADEGRVYVFNGPISGPLTIADADAVIVGVTADDALGASLAPAGDLNGDGFDDIVVGAPRTVALGNNNGPGQVFVFHGPLAGTIPASAGAAVLVGELDNDDFGISVAVGDVSGDGVADVVVGADQFFRNDGRGRVYVFHGPLSGTLQASNANAILRGTALQDLFGASVSAADLDGDGDSEVIVGAPGASLASGRGYVFRGPVSGEVAASSATFITKGGSGEQLGSSVCAARIYGDKHPSAVFGASSLTSGSPGYVAAYPNTIPPPSSDVRKR
jgi:hypothetical protein